MRLLSIGGSNGCWTGRIAWLLNWLLYLRRYLGFELRVLVLIEAKLARMYHYHYNKARVKCLSSA